jgi:hypothetical protein
VKREELGWAGHFIASRNCLFRRHTHVGPYCVSTVGDYYPAGGNEREKVGCNRFFETMVFDLSNGEDGPNRWCDIDAGAWQTREEANVGHEMMVNKWAELAMTQGGSPAGSKGDEG